MGKTIKRITCVGSGLIGQGWATLFAAHGYEVILQDIHSSQLKNADIRVKSNLAFLQKKGFFREDPAECARRIHIVADLGRALEKADYVQESVPDNYPVKTKTFADLDANASPDAILASSSSGLLMSEIQKVVSKPERCLLVHPFLPVHLVPLVEIVGGEQTAAETVENTADLMKKLGKVPVVLNKEVSGYIVNRLQAAVLREAVDLVANGVASAEDVDRAFCNGMGIRDPFIGPLLRACLAGDGIENFVKEYSASYHERWKSMAAWEELSTAMGESLIETVNAMPSVKKMPMERIKEWRDHMLVQMLKLNRKVGE